MCGFAGIIDKGLSPDQMRVTLECMGSRLIHRGPDGSGYYFDRESGLGLCHRRLAIVDLSPMGHQPMLSASGRFVLVFNGEIYNHIDIRFELKKEMLNFSFKGSSDTETLLCAIEAWGIEKTLIKCKGMFAFCLYDRTNSELNIVRDRAGEKPVYYGWQGTEEASSFVFGSELGSLEQHPKFKKEICSNSLNLYLRRGYVPAPYSIYKNIFKLKPGCFLTLQNGAKTVELTEYWSAEKTAKKAQSKPFVGNRDSARDKLDSLLSSAINQQMEADVPVGAMLSGGIDSSLAVAIMQKDKELPVSTFSIGFKNDEFNEAGHAKAVAQHLGTNHNELYVGDKEALELVPDIHHKYDEPFADSSQIPTFLVADFARRQVKVCLTGDGGDELFCGYNRYLFTNRYWPIITGLPTSVRVAIANFLQSLNSSQGTLISGLVGSILSSCFNISDVETKIAKIQAVISSASSSELYSRLIMLWPASKKILNRPTQHYEEEVVLGFSGSEEQMCLDYKTYLPDDILVKVDRATMNVSLESRAPFLDRDIYAFAWSLPLHFKLSGGRTKKILREVLDCYVPKKLIERPKVGFAVPLAAWLRGPLRGWAEDLLDPKKIISDGYLEPEPIRVRWAEHITGKRNWEQSLWCVLMFQAWLHSKVHIC